MVRAKVEVFQISETRGWDSKLNEGKGGYCPRKTIEANIVNGPPGSEDNMFEYLSGGTSIKLSTINPDAFNQFKIGGKYYVDFTPAE